MDLLRGCFTKLFNGGETISSPHAWAADASSRPGCLMLHSAQPFPTQHHSLLEAISQAGSTFRMCWGRPVSAGSHGLGKAMQRVIEPFQTREKVARTTWGWVTEESPPHRQVKEPGCSDPVLRAVCPGSSRGLTVRSFPHFVSCTLIFQFSLSQGFSKDL